MAASGGGRSAGISAGSSVGSSSEWRWNRFRKATRSVTDAIIRCAPLPLNLYLARARAIDRGAAWGLLRTGQLVLLLRLTPILRPHRRPHGSTLTGGSAVSQ